MASLQEKIANQISSNPYASVALSLASVYLATLCFFRRPARTSIIPPTKERVLLLGATSGVGRETALRYARRGAKVCLVGRRVELLNSAVQECLQPGVNSENILGLAGDFTKVEDMIRIRDTLQSSWQGVDTVIVCAGVSALRPLLDITDENLQETLPSAAGVQRVLDVSKAAITGNYYGPLVAFVTFVPLLEVSSCFPSILLVSSLAAVIPAPTRTLYASTKAASFILFKALSIEHPKVRFSCFMPSTIEGDFRASAVDSGTVRESDPSKSGLKKGAVAERCIRAVDRGERTVFMPWTMYLGMALYWIWPSFVEQKAREKYKFVPQ